MRRVIACALLVGAVGLTACAPKVVPVPTVTTPRFPDFIEPVVPLALVGSPAAHNFDRGWQFLQGGDLKNAEHEFGLALQAAPAFYPAEAAGGYVELARKDPKAALPHFDRALEKEPKDLSSLVGRGEALLATGQEGDAVTAFNAALSVDPSLVDLRRRVEVIQFRSAERRLDDARQAAKAGRLDQAISLYQDAIASSPDSAFLYRELAAVERQKGDTAPALVHFRQAVGLEPTDASSLAQIGELLEQQGDTEGALQAYASSVALEPSETVQSRIDALRTRAALDKLPQEYRAIADAPQITRADLAALIGVRLAPILQDMRTRDAVVVTDIRNNWAEPWIMAVARSGVMDPYANHGFQPKTLVRRVDLAQVVGRLLARISTPAEIKAWQDSKTRFSDLATTHLAYPAALSATASGVISVNGDGSFQPNRVVTGQEASASVDRLARLAKLPPSLR